MDDYSITRQQGEQRIKNWEMCYSSELAKHFKKINAKQFERLCSLELPAEVIHQAFVSTNQSEDVFDFEIMMGLDTIDSITEEFSFKPILRSSAEPNKYFEFQYIKAPSQTIQASTQISYELFDWLSKNWREMESEIVNDVFGAKLEDNSMAKIGSLKRLVRKRLLGYYFTKDINTTFWQFINDYRSHIKKIVFHLGADMNKEKHSDIFTFAPVFEVVFTKKKEDGTDKGDIFYLHRLGLRSYKLDDNDEVVYYEYMSPCPSTCPIL